MQTNYGISGIDHVQLAAPVGCEAEARQFFGEILGMQEIPKPELLVKRGGVWFQCGEQQVHIGVEADFRPAKKAHPAFVVRSFIDLRERLKSFGIEVQMDTSIPGVQRFFTHDPFGNRLEFVDGGDLSDPGFMPFKD